MSGRGKGAAKGTYSTIESETHSNGDSYGFGSTTSVTDKKKEVCLNNNVVLQARPLFVWLVKVIFLYYLERLNRTVCLDTKM